MTTTPFWERNVSRKAQREINAVAEAISVDARAVNILFNSFFDEDDPNMKWVDALDVSEEDFEYAKAAGLMFAPVELSHSELIGWIVETRAKLRPEAVSDAFISSLASGRNDVRSSLGSYAHSLHLSRHEFESGSEQRYCAICGCLDSGIVVDMSARNFRRLKWAGNVEQGELVYIACDLDLFSRLEPFTPSDIEKSIFHQMLDSIRKLPASAQLTDLSGAISGFFKLTKSDRQVVLEILGYAGVLGPRTWPRFVDEWIPPSRRKAPNQFYKKEWQYPVNGWTGEDGVDEGGVRFWFSRP